MKRARFAVLLDRSVFLEGQNWWKMPHVKNSNETFRVIFKQCVAAAPTVIAEGIIPVKEAFSKPVLKRIFF